MLYSNDAKLSTFQGNPLALSSTEQEELARNTQEEQQMIRLAESSSPVVLAVLARRCYVPASRLIASNDITPPSTLAYIYDQHMNDVKVPSVLARNRNTPDFILGKLLHHGNSMVRISAWKNPNLSSDDRVPENNPLNRGQ